MNLHVQGRRAYAYTGGKTFDPQLPCVVFIHGALNDHCVWGLLARWCAHHGYGVLAPDLPGHGLSQGPALRDVEALADWTLASLTAAGVQRPAALVGHSMGSLIGLETAGRAPDRVNRLVMIGTAYPMAVSQGLIDSARDTPLAAIEMVTNWSLSSHASKPSYPGPGSWLHGGLNALMRQVLNRSEALGWRGDPSDAPGGHADNLFELDFDICRRYAGGLAAADKLTCPTHLVLGSADRMTQPRQAADLEAALARKVPTQRHMLEGGHALMQELPDEVLEVLRAALR
jgi:pimeloyl-ACP methyl ester carboxylesterase